MPSTPSPDLQTYAERRARVARRLFEENAALVLFGGQLRTRANDTEFRFRPDSDFHYLTGLDEPGAFAVLVANERAEPELTLFVRPRDPDAEIWSGRRIGTEGARDRFGAATAHVIGDLDEQLPTLLDGRGCVYLPLGRWPAIESKLVKALTWMRRHNRDGRNPPARYGEVADLLGEERLLKDASALASLRKAIEISAAGHVAAMRSTRPGMWEYEVEALIEYEFRRRGSSGPGYGTIVGTGDNATILHYVDNRDRLEPGDVLLIDAGAEWDYFSGDITRSWPVSGKFSPEQRDLYEVVLAANLAGIELARVGGDLAAIHDACVRSLSAGMIELGFLEGPVDRVIESRDYQRFYLHRTSHWLGVDVHDAGRYTLEGKPRMLTPGHVFTVEPGLYVPRSCEDVPEGFRGLGIRIEDDVLITQTGHEVLTAAVPKQVVELEAIIGSG
ncbi:aminopeptidase P N-terminal domain-containing protein [Nannocystaceae bacterium ST9]